MNIASKYPEWNRMSKEDQRYFVVQEANMLYPDEIIDLTSEDSNEQVAMVTDEDIEAEIKGAMDYLDYLNDIENAMKELEKENERKKKIQVTKPKKIVVTPVDKAKAITKEIKGLWKQSSKNQKKAMKKMLTITIDNLN